MRQKVEARGNIHLNSAQTLLNQGAWFGCLFSLRPRQQLGYIAVGSQD